MKQWTSPIRVLVIYLVLLACAASFSWGGFSLQFWLNQLFHLSLLLGTSFIVYQILLKVGQAKPTRFEHRLITSLILFLLFDPMIPWWVFALLGGVTELIQRLIRFPTGPVFNPAALGAVLVTFLGYFPAWWGVSFAPRFDVFPGGMSIAMLSTVPIAGYVAHKYKKLPIVLISSAVFAITYWLVFKTNPLFLLFEGTLAFFLLVMAVEPKTSPVLLLQQYLFGAVLGLLIVVLQLIYFAEPYSGALLLCNLLFNTYKNKQWLNTSFISQKVTTTN